jgi:hypothetical protein
VVICLNIAEAVFLLMGYRIELGGKKKDYSAEELEGLNSLALGLTGLLLVVLLATALAFSLWIYTAYKNLDFLNVEGLCYSAGWAAGAFFVPVLNLFRPYQIVQEIWKASSPEGKLRERTAWLNANDSPLVICWWAVGLATAIVPSLFLGFAYFGGITLSALVLYVVAALGIAGLMVTAVCAIGLVAQIQQRQRRKYQRLLDFARHGRLAS